MTTLFPAGLIAQVVLGIAFIAAGVLLFIGATIRRRSFVLPWLVVAVRKKMLMWIDPHLTIPCSMGGAVAKWSKACDRK